MACGATKTSQNQKFPKPRPTPPKQRLPSPLQSAFAAQPLSPLFPNFRLPSSAQEPKNEAVLKINMKRILSLLAAGWRMLCGRRMGNWQESAYIKAEKIKADQGDVDAQLYLGELYYGQYYEGVRTEKDYAEAAKWYRKAAEQGNAQAQYQLGYMYDYGKGVPKDKEEVVKWWRKAAEQGHAGAQGALGRWYHWGGDGVPEDKVEAAKWYRKAAEQGEGCAQEELGKMYYKGEGVPQDYMEAAHWCRKAAEQRVWDHAQLYLGWMYHEGKGVPQDYVEAAKWYRKAAEQAHHVAQLYLGWMYHEGKGVPQDYVEAYAWYLLVKTEGLLSNKQVEIFSDLEKRLTAEQMEKGQARTAALRRLIKERNPDAIRPSY